jgi:4-amino-4-deoxy-L-arabinose transferase-like glycosyltransferase
MSRWSRREVLAVVLVLAISLVLRLMNQDALIVSDEMRWTCRSLGFRKAILEGDWLGTFRTGHPGVVTTWLGSIFIPGSQHEAQEVCQVTDDAKQLYLAGDTSQELSRRLGIIDSLLFSGRTGVAIFTWLSIIAGYLLVRLLWGVDVAVAGLILVALSPFYLAHSRFMHLDAVLSSLMSLSVLSLVAAVSGQSVGLRSKSTRFSRADSAWARAHMPRSPDPGQGERSPRGFGNRVKGPMGAVLSLPRLITWRIGFLMLSGAIGGLAALQKSPAFFLAPFSALLLLVDAVRRGGSRKAFVRAARDLLIWGAVAAIAYVALWPTMWGDPVGTIRKVLGTAVGYAEEGHTLGNYFMGRPVLDPGWSFYPIATLFRLTPLSLVGLLGGLGWLMNGDGHARGRFGFQMLLLYGVLFGAFMSAGAKKFDRYILPVFPALEIAAGFGLVWLVRVAGEWREQLSVSSLAIGGAVAALVLQLGLAWPHRPHYLSYFNPLLGGPRRAKDVLLMGWGEGYGEAISYLNNKPSAEELQVAVGRFSGFAPLFHGEPRSMDTYSVWETDYVVNYLSQVQRGRNREVLEEYFYNPAAEPEYTVNLHGVDYLWIYPNVHYVEPVRYLEEHAKPDEKECLLVNGGSLFAEHYQHGLPAYEFHAQWNPAEETYTYWSIEQMAGLLDDMRLACDRVWYARYPEYETNEYLKLLDSRGLLLQKEAFPHMEMRLYRLVKPQTDRALDLRFGNIRLLGYTLTDPLPAWGRDGGLALEWEATEPLDEDYSTFLHLYDAHGHRIAQGDSLLVDEALRPTSRWEPGVSKVALYHMSIPPGSPPGQYELAVGVYDLATGHRLPLFGAGEESEDKSVRLPFEIGVPDQGPPLEALDVSHLLKREVTPQLELLGYDLEHKAILAGDAVPVRLTWKALDSMGQDYRLQLGLRGRDGSAHVMDEFALVTTDYSSSRWRAGELLQEWYCLAVGEDVPTGEMELILNLLDQDGQPVGSQPMTVADVWVQSMKPTFEMPEHIGESRVVNLGDEITFLGYDSQTSVRAGEHLPVTVYWQAQREIEQSYKVFVHLYDQAGNIIAQQDRIPGLAARPTTTWETGEIVGDRLLVPIDGVAPTGVYRLVVGLYNQETGERFPAFDPEGQRLEGDRILLKQVEIEP